MSMADERFDGEVFREGSGMAPFYRENPPKLDVKSEDIPDTDPGLESLQAPEMAENGQPCLWHWESSSWGAFGQSHKITKERVMKKRNKLKDIDILLERVAEAQSLQSILGDMEDVSSVDSLHPVSDISEPSCLQIVCNDDADLDGVLSRANRIKKDKCPGYGGMIELTVEKDTIDDE